MNFKPLNDRVVLKPIIIKQTTQSGLILALNETNEGDTIYGKVVTAGPGKVVECGLIPTTVKEGDIVIFRPNMALRHLHLGQEFLIIRESELSAVVEGVEESDLPVFDENSFKQGPKELESLL